MIATLVSTFVCTGVLNFQMNQIEGVCTTDQPNHFTCPGINTFFTAAVLWGTIGPHKVFGKGGQYTQLLIGFPFGLVLPFIFYYAQKKFPARGWLRQVHPVILMYGGICWSPYNLSYVWPAVPIGWFAMVYMKRRYLGLWSKVGVARVYILKYSTDNGAVQLRPFCILVFSHCHCRHYHLLLSAMVEQECFLVGLPRASTLYRVKSNCRNRWGNDVVSKGCEGDSCTRLTLADGEIFGPGPGQFN